MNDRHQWLVVGSAAAALAGLGARKALGLSWERLTGNPAPENPEMRHVSWRDALLWAAASGLAIGVARLVGQRVAAEGWRAFVGDDPPHNKLA